jgi:HprK-related kinase A
MRHSFAVKVGPRGFCIGSPWREPIAALETLYQNYPKPEGGIVDHRVRLEPVNLIRRFVRPSVTIQGDYTIPEAAPLPLSMGMLAAEMGMNLQVALGERHYLLLHAASVERDGKVLILTGESGSGKSTLSAVLMARGWRLLGDEFALIDPVTGEVHPFPRPISLKNAGVDAVAALVNQDRFGPWLRGTPKGDLRHLLPDAKAIAGMDTPALPSLILFPAFGHTKAIRSVGKGEVFVRLTQASTNYTALGETGFGTLTRLIEQTPARAIDFQDTASGIDLVEQAWAGRG